MEVGYTNFINTNVIRSMQNELSTILKHVGSLLRFFKFYDAQNCSKNVLEISVSKSPKTIKLLHFEEQKYNVSDQLLNKYLD